MHWRTWQLMKAFPGFTPQAIDETPAATLDWLLQIDITVREAQQRDVEG